MLGPVFFRIFLARQAYASHRGQVVRHVLVAQYISAQGPSAGNIEVRSYPLQRELDSQLPGLLVRTLMLDPLFARDTLEANQSPQVDLKV